jgi:hypothetical protein
VGGLALAQQGQAKLLDGLEGDDVFDRDRSDLVDPILPFRLDPRGKPGVVALVVVDDPLLDGGLVGGEAHGVEGLAVVGNPEHLGSDRGTTIGHRWSTSP